MEAVRCFSLLLLLVASNICRGNAGESEYCDAFDSIFPSPALSSYSVQRRVDLTDGNDSVECLNLNSSDTSPPPCRSLQYALHETENISIGIPVSSLAVLLGPGVYTSLLESTRIINSNEVAIIGAGVSETFVVCRNEETVCEYENFQIMNSTNVTVRGITFTRCGPITSAFYVGFSDFVSIENCSFE